MFSSGAPQQIGIFSRESALCSINPTARLVNLYNSVKQGLGVKYSKFPKYAHII